MIVDHEKVFMYYLIHDEQSDSGSYVIKDSSIFHLGKGKSAHFRKPHFTADDVRYNYLQIIIPNRDTITLRSKQEILAFISSGKTSFNSKVDKKINKNYSKIGIIR